MKTHQIILTGLLLLICLAVQAEAAHSMTDPYRILEKHHEAIGGLDRLKAIKTIYTEGTFSIVGSDLHGTFKQWLAKPLRMRQEVDLTIVKTVQGDNGEYSWGLDPNGKVQIHKDEQTLKEREVKKLMQNYAHLDVDSPYFTLIFEGTDTVHGETCYVVSIANKINETIQRNYYSTTTFYLLKTITIELDKEEQTVYSDFRSLNGVVQPFQETVEILPIGEQQVFEYTTYEFNRNMNSALFEPPHEDVEDFEFVNGDYTEDIPFYFILNNIYLPGNVDGRERLWILDCGASGTVIDFSYAVELGSELQGPIKAQAPSGVVDLYYVTIPPYTVKGIRFKEQRVMTMSISNLFKRAHGMDVVGILGYDFLSRFVAKIDYANERLSLYHPDKFEYHGEGTIIDAPLDEDRMFSVSVTVDKKYSGRWQLDIGASGVSFLYPYASAHNLLNLPGIDVIATGAAGASKSRRSQFETMELNSFVVENPVIGVPEEVDKGCFADRSLVGNIGNTFLRHFVLYLDYKNQQIIVEKGNDYNKDFPSSKSGLQLWYTENYDIAVMFAAPNTPSHEAGFQKGDIIKAINGIDVHYFDGIIAIRKLFEEEAGTTYEFDVVRNSKPLKIELTLRDLF
jgi:hypothetical protein